MVQSLSLCFKIPIHSDRRDGFRFAWNHPRDWTGHGARCTCSSCLLMPGIIGQGEIVDRIPAFTQLTLRIFFECGRGQGNTRLTIGHFANGRPKKGKLYRPKNPIPLVCVEDPERIEQFVTTQLVEDSPRLPGARGARTRGLLHMFSVWRKKVESVDFHVFKSHISHNPNNQPPHPADKCWCVGRAIDAESLEQSGLIREIRKRLIDGSA
jgi:hypothetical protein